MARHRDVIEVYGRVVLGIREFQESDAPMWLLEAAKELCVSLRQLSDDRVFWTGLDAAIKNLPEQDPHLYRQLRAALAAFDRFGLPSHSLTRVEGAEALTVLDRLDILADGLSWAPPGHDVIVRITDGLQYAAVRLVASLTRIERLCDWQIPCRMLALEVCREAAPVDRHMAAGESPPSWRVWRLVSPAVKSTIVLGGAALAVGSTVRRQRGDIGPEAALHGIRLGAALIIDGLTTEMDIPAPATGNLAPRN